jgi:Sigma-70, region 4/Fibronectin type III domain
MENPVGYLYRVGRSRARPRRRPPLLPSTATVGIPEIEPRLPDLLAALPERQRTCVVLVHGFEWTHQEVATLLGVSVSTVRNHLARGLKRLRAIPFRDITSGNNGAACLVGFDLCSGRGSWADTATTPPSPTVPAAPSLSASAGSGVVHLTWSAPSDGGSAITSYKVYRGTSSGGETLLTTLGNVTLLNDTAVSNDTAYYYEVSAVNSVGGAQRTGFQRSIRDADPTGVRRDAHHQPQRPRTNQPPQVDLMGGRERCRSEQPAGLRCDGHLRRERRDDHDPLVYHGLNR